MAPNEDENVIFIESVTEKLDHQNGTDILKTKNSSMVETKVTGSHRLCVDPVSMTACEADSKQTEYRMTHYE